MIKKKDLLTDAIADAKLIRETAMANAKQALEEAFTPKLSSMFTQKVREELGDDEEDLPVDDVPVAENDADPIVPPIEEPTDDSGQLAEDDDIPADDDEELDFEVDDDETPAPVAEEDEQPAVPADDEEDLDLDAIIAELEADDEPVDEPTDIPSDDDEEVPMAEQDDGMPSEIPSPDPEEDDDEEVDLDELYKSLVGEDEDGDADDIELDVPEPDDDQDVANLVEVKRLKKQLAEAYNAIGIVKKEMNNVNLLNSKLLFANKLFKAYNLNESAKKQVIETIDRANSPREAKLIFVTLAESFKTNRNLKTNLSESLKRGIASKATASTKPNSKILTENTELAARWKKLARIGEKK